LNVRTRIKICGVRRESDVEAAVEAGADAIGLVFYAPSPRHQSVSRAAELARALPAFVTPVGLFVNAALPEVEAAVAAIPGLMLQFHGDETPGFCALADSYGVSVKRLRQLGVVGEINYQPFDVDGRIVDRPELRALVQRVLAVDGPHLQSLSRRDDRWVVAVAGGQEKLDAVRGALEGRFMNVLVTDQDVAAALVESPPGSASRD